MSGEMGNVVMSATGQVNEETACEWIALPRVCVSVGLPVRLRAAVPWACAHCNNTTTAADEEESPRWRVWFERTVLLCDGIQHGSEVSTYWRLLNDLQKWDIVSVVLIFFNQSIQLYLQPLLMSINTKSGYFKALCPTALSHCGVHKDSDFLNISFWPKILNNIEYFEHKYHKCTFLWFNFVLVEVFL